MSKIRIQANAVGTGVTTLTSTASSTNRTVIFPDTDDTLVPQATTDALASRVTDLESGGGGGSQTGAEIKSLYELESSAFTDAQFTKLAAIEDSATIDQTDAEIRAAVEAATDSNVFTDADQSKLNALENNSTEDQTGAEIKSLYELELSAFTDAQFTKLAAIEDSATVDQTDAEIRAAVEAATDSNVFTDADQSKLNALENNSTEDQTGAEIKALYELESNAFTDTQFTKLSGIEALATADQTDAEIRAAVEAATDSNVFTDADHSKLDGLSSTLEDLTDTPVGYGNAGQVLSSTGVGTEWTDQTSGGGSGFLIDTPTITSPASGVIDFFGEITSSPFTTVASFSGAHDFTRWQLSFTSDFAVIERESTVGNLTSVLPGIGAALQEVYVRVQYGSDGHLSGYSDSLSFTTPDIFIEAPTLTVPDAPNDVLLSPTLSTSAFSVFNGTDTHASTDWRIIRDSDGAIVFESLTNTVDLLDIVVPGGLLAVDTAYTFQARHTGATFGSSTVVSVSGTTFNVFIEEPTLTVSGEPNDVPISPTLSTNPFSIFNGIDTHVSTDWRVTRVSDSTVVFESLTNTVDLLSILVPGGLLDIATAYTFEARHTGVTFGNSAFASVTRTTALVFIDEPTLTIEGAPSDVTETPLLSTSAFSVNGGTDTHVSTDWRVTKDSDSSVAFESLANTVDLVSISVTAGLLEVSTAYTFEARHTGDEYGSSAFASAAGTTEAQFSYENYLAVSHNGTPFITIYGNDVDTSTKLDDPTGGLPNAVFDAFATVFSADGTYLAVSYDRTPYLTIYKRDGDIFTKLADPTSLFSAQSLGVAFSSDGTYLAVAHSANPFISIYKRTGDTFAKLADPVGGLPPNTGNAVAFSPDGTYLAVPHTQAPYLTIYKRSGDVFSNLAQPTVLPIGTSRSAAFSSDGTYLAVGHDNGSNLVIYKRSGDTFAKLADPTGGLPPGSGNGVAFTQDGIYLAVAHSASPYVTIYKRSGDAFAKLAGPTGGLPAGTGNEVAFSQDGTYLAVGHVGTPFITIYKRDGDVFNKLADPAVLPPGTGLGVAYYPGSFFPALVRKEEV